ncbi:hypothetical protein C1752_01774 [Acaryochloris thomasi RCC1774]|uniref:Uncharacterized protein n=1 Tax=Acaryochloris thomasi RCC1774 TaxID=1764569 RepID=A0A2W1JK92_9CYAN|nr:hypothetical protein [Acaryochloris thomasi]PZD73830.1 hypothetical protein C1752_01774 [Acaryochloris thomasi RCC1774]
MNETSEQTATLHPALQTALASLDLTVESELTYYRQQQAQLLIPPEESAALVSESQPEIEAEPQALASAIEAPEPPPIDPAMHPEPVVASASSAESETLAEPETLPDAALVPEPEIQEAALVTTHNDRPAETEDMIAIETPPDAALDSETAEPLSTPPPADFPKSYENYLDPSIEDYLESSEALLRHLEESKAEPEQKPKQNKKLLPGLLLALFVLSLGALMLRGLRRGKRPADPPPAETVSPSPSPSLAPSPSLGLPQLPITPSPTPSPAPSGTATPSPTPSSIPLQPPSPTVTASPSPSPSPASP